MNEAYCRDISIKTRTSLDIKRRNGDFVGAFPVYGYMKSEENKNLLVPDPYAARVVQDIFRMRLEMCIRDRLSCPARRGKKKTVAGQVASCAHNGFSGYCGGFE